MNIVSHYILVGEIKDLKPSIFAYSQLFDILSRMTIDEFQKVDLRVGKIVSAERVEGSEKLLKLHVDIGEENLRQILSGIAKAYTPEEMIEKEVIVIVNLDPRMMMGMESQGMLLAAHGENGEPVLLGVEREVQPGSKVT